MSEPNEHTSLLRRDSDPPESKQPSILGEVKDLLKSTVPISASFALQNIVQALSIVIAGSLGPDQLDIALYGFMFASCTGSMIAIGGATALDTLCGQAVTSIKTRSQPTILGRHLQQSLFNLSIIFLLVITPIWLASGRLFVALGQETQFALGTGQFLVLLLPGGYLQMVAECLKKYGQVQGHSNAVGYVVCIAAAVGIISNILLIRVAGLGANGAPAVFFIYQLVTVVLLSVLLVRRERHGRTVKLIKSWRELVDGLGVNLFLAMTGILTIATEWWRQVHENFEILAMMAAKLRPIEVSAQSILMSADLIFTTISLGIGVAASHRIGQLLGANKPMLARRAAITPYILSMGLGAVELVSFLPSVPSLGIYSHRTQMS
ncbi:hypothetical protein G7046_g815 [Stylonectria norvegica]|nr:hypothetical protein G7046_g815 [Stylonectria norvegica]